jgi:hypothetical protein
MLVKLVGLLRHRRLPYVLVCMQQRELLSCPHLYRSQIRVLIPHTCQHFKMLEFGLLIPECM